MQQYQCRIGSFEVSVQAATPAEAAQKACLARMRKFAWFANESPGACSVWVNGVEYVPSQYASPEHVNVY